MLLSRQSFCHTILTCKALGEKVQDYCQYWLILIRNWFILFRMIKNMLTWFQKSLVAHSLKECLKFTKRIKGFDSLSSS